MKDKIKSEKSKLLKRELEALKTMLRAVKQQNKATELENEALKIQAEALIREKEAYKLKYDSENKDYKPLKEENKALKLENQALRDKYKLLKRDVEVPKIKPGIKKKIHEPIFNDNKFIDTIIYKVKEKTGQLFPSKDIPTRLAKELRLLANNDSFTTMEIRNNYHISRPTAQRDIRCLRECGWIKLKAGKSKGIFILTEEGSKFMNDL